VATPAVAPAAPALKLTIAAQQFEMKPSVIIVRPTAIAWRHA
jgi:hypothetical protein